MGETLPFLLWRLDSRREFDLGEKLAADALTTSGICDPGALIATLQALGDDNVMFSVDYPYEDPQVASDFIESTPISEEVRAKVCHGNAERLLRL